MCMSVLAVSKLINYAASCKLLEKCSPLKEVIVQDTVLNRIEQLVWGMQSFSILHLEAQIAYGIMGFLLFS